MAKKMARIRRNEQKFRELILFISQRSEGDDTFGATKLNKLLFYADFLAYLEFGKPITGQTYQKLPWGPAPRHLIPTLEKMERDGEVVQATRKHFGRPQRRTIAMRSANLSRFTAEEVELVTTVIEHFSNTNAKEISGLSHLFIGWQAAEEGEEIPYQTVLIRKPELNATAIKRAKQLARKAKECVER